MRISWKCCMCWDGRSRTRNVTFQHPGLKFVYLLSGEVRYRYGSKVVAMGTGDSLLFDATALHGIEAIGNEPLTYLSVVLTLHDEGFLTKTWLLDEGRPRRCFALRKGSPPAS